MTLPRRWLDDDGASSAVRDVLRSDRGMDPPDGAEDAVWLGLAAKIAAGAAVTAASVGTAKTAAAATTTVATSTAATGTTVTAVASGGLLKSILIGAFGGVIAVTGYSAIAPPSAPERAPDAAIVPAPPVKDLSNSPGSKGVPRSGADDVAPSKDAPSVVPPSATDAPPSSAVQPSPTAASTASSAPTDAPPASTEASGAAGAPAPGSPEERASRLRDESDMLNQARAALRGGDTAGTMRLLEQARQKFPGGVLGQEREALAIEALAKSGARAEASSRAAAFIQAHPNSPHAARLQVFVQK